jgi:hypothetical protein
MEQGITGNSSFATKKAYEAPALLELGDLSQLTNYSVSVRVQ